MSNFPLRKFLTGFILWLVFLKSATGQNTGSFEPPPSTNTDVRIKEIQDELIRIQSEILSINLILGSSNNSQELKARLSILEEQFAKLNQQIADERRENAAANEKHDKEIAILFDFYNSLDIQMKALQESFEKKFQEDEIRRIPAEIVDLIRNHEFRKAESLLLQIQAEEKIHGIVHDVYANSLGNVDVLLDFAKSLSRVDLSFGVLDALRYEMRANGHHDPYKVMSLARALDSKIINNKASLAEVKSKAIVLRNDVVTDLKDTSTSTLKTAMYLDNYQRNDQVERLSQALFDFDFQVSDDVIQRMVRESYPAVSAVKIADNIFSSKIFQQRISGQVALFWKLKESNKLNDEAVLSIGDYLNQTQSSFRGQLRPTEIDAVNQVIVNMPQCARYLSFATRVSFWNQARSGYLYAASSAFNFDRDRRMVFTWGEGVPINQGEWYVEKKGNNFYFKNTVHNEYMYAASYKPYDRDRRRVFTWIPGGYDSDNYAWKVELHDNQCRLKNVGFNEYLFSSQYTLNKWRNYVMTWIPGTAIHDPEFQWEILG